jgi:hypothetical protein
MVKMINRCRSPNSQFAPTLTLKGNASMTIYYKHHIVPRHAGGTDDTSNIVLLTAEEHAEAHRILYEQHGRWQDYVAWKAMTGHIGKEEIIRLTQSLATKGKKQSLEHIEKRKLCGEKNPMYGMTGEKNPNYGNRGEKNPLFGKKHPEEWNVKKRLALSGKTLEMRHGKEKAEEIKNKFRKPKTEEHKAKLRKPKPKVVCRLKDKREMSLGNFMNWNKNGR